MKRTLFLLMPALLGLLALPAQAQQPVVVQEAEVIAQFDPAALAEEFIISMAQQQFAAAVQDYSASVTDVTTQTLQQNWNDIIAESGSFQGIVSSQTLDQTGSEAIVLVRCQFAQTPRDLFVVVSGASIADFSPAE